MRKVLFALVLVAFCVAIASAQEGDRKYSEFASRMVKGGAAQTTVTPRFGNVWRYDITVFSVADADTARVRLVCASGDTVSIALGGGGPYAGGTVVIPFYGPEITSAVVKAYSTSKVTLSFWK